MAWNSKTKIKGVPLVSAGFYAEGFIAIGFSGVGVITIAQFGIGFISITQFGIGVISIAQFSAGIFAIGQIAAGIIFSLGAVALGFISVGYGETAGYYSIKDPPDLFVSINTIIETIRNEPGAMLLWLLLWSILIWFLYSRRDMITKNMKLYDLFRSREKHSNPLIRLNSLISITSQEKLANFVRKDPSKVVKKTALKKITNQEFLSEFARDYSSGEIQKIAIAKLKDKNLLSEIAKSTENPAVAKALLGKINNQEILIDIARNAASSFYRAAAVKKLIKPDPLMLAELAYSEENQDVINAIIDRIIKIRKNNFNDILILIITNGKSSNSRYTAISRLKNPDDSYLAEIALSDDESKICMAAVRNINNIDLLEKIAVSRAHKKTRSEAINRIENKTLLSGIIENDSSETIRSLAEKRLIALRPLYYAFKVEIKCPYCSHPVFINGPVRQIQCSNCLSTIKLKKGFWKEIVNSDPGKSHFQSFNNMIIEKSYSPPCCTGCGTQLDTDDIPGEDINPAICSSCGLENPALPFPKWLRGLVYGEHIFCAENEGNIDSKKSMEMKPVSISCIKCGAPLEIRQDTPRNAICGYCKTSQYLPDALWLSIHPVKIKQTWYIRCSYKERIKNERQAR